MTNTETLRALVERWRAAANRRQAVANDQENDDPAEAAWNGGIAAQSDECADELEQALSAGGGVAEGFVVVDRSVVPTEALTKGVWALSFARKHGLNDEATANIVFTEMLLAAAPAAIPDDQLDGEYKHPMTLREVMEAEEGTPAAPVADLIESAHQIAFEIGGQDDGEYHFDPDQLEDFVRRLLKAAPAVEVDEAVARDADRYRFLRNHANEVGSMSPAVILATAYFAVDSEETEGFVFGEDLDKAVDSALTASLGWEGEGNG